jgi:MoxR-like ATPase
MAKGDLTTIARVAERFKRAEEEMGKVIVGQRELLKSLQLALLADGHILLEGLPGLAKTLAVNTLAQVVECEFKRIQFAGSVTGRFDRNQSV